MHSVQNGQPHFKNLAANVPDHFETLWIKELKSFNLYVLTVNSHTHIVIASLASAQYMQQFTQVDSTLF